MTKGKPPLSLASHPSAKSSVEGERGEGAKATVGQLSLLALEPNQSTTAKNLLGSDELRENALEAESEPKEYNKVVRQRPMRKSGNHISGLKRTNPSQRQRVSILASGLSNPRNRH